MITLYPHQESWVKELGLAFGRHRAVLGQAPTGCGKTVAAAAIAQRAGRRGNSIIFAVHRRNLIKQTSATFDEFGIEHSVIGAGYSYDPGLDIHVASIDTLRNRMERIKSPTILVIDEAHMAAAKTWAKVANFYKSRGTRILGLSATPSRLDGKPLGDLFDHMVKGPSVKWLMDEGYLSKYVAYAPSEPDLSSVHTRMGDFEKHELIEAVDKPKLTGDAARHYLKYASGTRAICYCCSIEHSKHVAEHFNANAIPAAHIDGKTPKDEQARVIRAFADGEYSVLCNVELITTGFDLSAQVGRDVPVETIIILRPTQSEALHLQMIGRGLRRKPNPAVILDHSGNILRMGLPDQEREWTLEGKKKRAKKTEDAVPVRQCPQCYAAHEPAPQCPQCGFVYPVQSRELEEVDGELHQITEAMIKRNKIVEQARADTLDKLIALARARGYRNPEKWASFVFASRKNKQQKRPQFVTGTY